MRRSQLDEASFRAYAATQIDKSLRAIRSQALGPVVSDRSDRLVRLMNEFLPHHRDEMSVLCVGCRSGQELAHVKRVCRVGEVRGLDLFSDDPCIEVGDMHAMPFDDARFDVVYACHSLEHAYDPLSAVGECVRVLKPGGLLVCELPVNFTPSATDRWNVRSSETFVEYLPPRTGQVLFRQDTADVMRLVIRMGGAGA